MSLGAFYKDGIWTFRVYSSSASRIDLVLFEEENTQHPAQRLQMERSLEGVFSVSVQEDLDGYLYGYQVGNGDKRILLDPYAIEIGQEFIDEKQPALGVLRFPSVFDWQGVTKPNTAYSETVIYEGNVKGLTKLHPAISESERGTFLGLSAPEFVNHLKMLGVTALEILPICYHLDEKFLLKAGLTNYWGYNPVNYFALSPRFAVKDSPLTITHQFKTAIRELHRAGIEVIVDVVFNHTGEGSVERGRNVSLRGLDFETYYRSKNGQDIDFTGCGNTLNTDSTTTVKLICDSLRYFAEEIQVDGFRFDLASALARNGEKFDPNHPLLVSIAQDPVLSKVKLISEPWDATMEGYQLGRFPKIWREWNDKFRDITRRFWRGDGNVVGEFASALSGSSNIFGGNFSRSINFVTAHDGFTLRDLVTYSEKQNEENAQNGLDGSDHNYSFNCGIEGETPNGEVNKLRNRIQKNFLATLLLSKGIPMILGGDEINRTQNGNNNAYCHDKEWNYLNWDEQSDLKKWVSNLVNLRQIMTEITDETFYSESDVEWLSQGGAKFNDWNSDVSKPLILRINSRQEQRALLLAFNPTDHTVDLGFSNLELILSSSPINYKSPFTLPEKSFAAFRVN